MNEISATDAVGLFHATMDRDAPRVFGRPYHDEDLWLPTKLHIASTDFPEDIAARDFLESLKLYREMYDDGIITRYAPRKLRWVEEWESPLSEDLVEGVATLDESAIQKLPPKLRLIVELILENRNICAKEIAKKLGRAPKTISNQLGDLYRRVGARNRSELNAKIPPTFKLNPS